MISHRLRGLTGLHVCAATMLAALVLLAYASVYRYAPWPDAGINPDVSLVGYLMCVVLGMIAGSRHLQRMASRFHLLRWTDAAWLASRQIAYVALVVFAFMFAFKDRNMSRLFMGSYLCLCWFALLLVNQGLPRFLCRIFFERAHKLPTLFIGTQKGLARLTAWLSSKQALGLHPVGFLTDEAQPDAGTTPPFLGGLADLRSVIDQRQVLQVIMLEIPRTQTEGRFIIETCQKAGCRLLIYSNLAEMFRHPLVTVTEEGHQFYSLQEEPLEDPLNRVLKRLYDVAVSLPIVTLFLPPLCLWVWVMQRLQAPGRVFFSQERTGHNGQTFHLLKFRSMYSDERVSATEARQARRGDDRVYPFGQFLRVTSLDEFPQFINVLKGQMSIVGPRPHMIAHDTLFAHQMNTYRTRFFVKPGITGLAQCNGYRGEITEPALLQRRIEHDLTYVTEWSIWLDVQITLKTALQVVRPPKSAY